ncbi:MAG: response regulator [Alkalibacterium sp.]|nr:response regulator [Alkalibacterium sp.]
MLYSETTDESKNRILVVDDEPLLTNIIKTRLGYLGYDVDNARDGQEALVKLDRHVYDLMLLDLVLPKVTGMEVLKKIKEGPGNENMKIIMISEKQNEPAMLKSLRLGADDFSKNHFH